MSGPTQGLRSSSELCSSAPYHVGARWLTGPTRVPRQKNTTSSRNDCSCWPRRRNRQGQQKHSLLEDVWLFWLWCPRPLKNHLAKSLQTVQKGEARNAFPIGTQSLKLVKKPTEADCKRMKTTGTQGPRGARGAADPPGNENIKLSPDGDHAPAGHFPIPPWKLKSDSPRGRARDQASSCGISCGGHQ
jgi:hypothetical protein